jgi:hypothetical protein
MVLGCCFGKFTVLAPLDSRVLGGNRRYKTPRRGDRLLDPATAAKEAAQFHCVRVAFRSKNQQTRSGDRLGACRLGRPYELMYPLFLL